MSIGAFIPFIGPIIELIKRVIPDKDKQDELISSLEQSAIDADARIAEAQSQVVTAEAQGNWLQASWRPILMYFLMFIVAWHMLVLPFVAYLIGTEIGTLVGLASLPDWVGSLLIIGMGGYIGGRSLEKIIGKAK